MLGFINLLFIGLLLLQGVTIYWLSENNAEKLHDDANDELDIIDITYRYLPFLPLVLPLFTLQFFESQLTITQSARIETFLLYVDTLPYAYLFFIRSVSPLWPFPILVTTSGLMLYWIQRIIHSDPMKKQVFLLLSILHFFLISMHSIILVLSGKILFRQEVEENVLNTTTTYTIIDAELWLGYILLIIILLFYIIQLVVNIQENDVRIQLSSNGTDNK